MELWDIYDENQNKTGRVHERGMPMANGDYHLVVNIWIKNSNSEYLITKRTPNKTSPNQWECQGGSALAGEDSLQAALREAKEEAGIALNPKNGRVLLTQKRKYDFKDVWLFIQDFSIDDVVLQQDETCDARWADKHEILRMLENGEFVEVLDYLDDLFAQEG